MVSIRFYIAAFLLLFCFTFWSFSDVLPSSVRSTLCTKLHGERLRSFLLVGRDDPPDKDVGAADPLVDILLLTYDGALDSTSMSSYTIFGERCKTTRERHGFANFSVEYRELNAIISSSEKIQPYLFEMDTAFDVLVPCFSIPYVSAPCRPHQRQFEFHHATMQHLMPNDYDAFDTGIAHQQYPKL